MKKEIECTEPKIVSYPIEGIEKPKKWYVYFRVKVNGSWEMKRHFKDINHLQTFDERMEAAIKVRDGLRLSLENGWFPTEVIEKMEANSNIPMFREADILLTDAISSALEQRSKTLAWKSQKDYASVCNLIISRLKQKKWGELKLKESSRIPK